jgi:hypothetical protein
MTRWKIKATVHGLESGYVDLLGKDDIRMVLSWPFEVGLNENRLVKDPEIIDSKGC